MVWLINEFGLGIGLIILAILAIVLLYILYFIIKAAVKSGTSEQRDLLERHNELLKAILAKEK